MKTSTSQSPIDDYYVIVINQLLCLPKAELKTKKSTKRELCCRLVEFLVFNSIYLKISIPANGRNRVLVHIGTYAGLTRKKNFL